MSRKYKFRDNEKLYFISFAVVYWLDVFIRSEYKYELLVDIPVMLTPVPVIVTP